LKLESERFSLAQGKQVKDTENDTEETKKNANAKKSMMSGIFLCRKDEFLP
jgi:hypothetical protein